MLTHLRAPCGRPAAEPVRRGDDPASAFERLSVRRLPPASAWRRARLAEALDRDQLDLARPALGAGGDRRHEGRLTAPLAAGARAAASSISTRPDSGVSASAAITAMILCHGPGGRLLDRRADHRSRHGARSKRALVARFGPTRRTQPSGSRRDNAERHCSSAPKASRNASSLNPRTRDRSRVPSPNGFKGPVTFGPIPGRAGAPVTRSSRPRAGRRGRWRSCLRPPTAPRP